MKPLALIILFAISTGFYARAQSVISFQEVDRESLKHYYAGQWDSVIAVGKLAQKADINYYYLNYRLGVAYYNVNDFFKATHHFSLAVKQNKVVLFDTVFKEMYFNSLIYSNQKTVAIRIMEETTLGPLELPRGTRGKVFASYMLGQLPKTIPLEELTMNSTNEFSKVNFQERINLLTLGTSSVLNGFLKIDATGSYAALSMVSAVENKEVFHLRHYSVDQLAANIKAEITLKRSNTIELAFGITKVNGNPYGNINEDYLQLGNFDFTNNSLMVGTQITHLHKNMRFGVNGAYSNFNDKDEIQGGLIYHWYPFGNLNLYSMTELSILKYQSDLRTIINQKIGFKINTKLWAEMQLIYGDIQYSTVISDNFSYEIPNHTHALADANLIYLLNPSLNLVLGTQYLWKFSDQEESANNLVLETKTINYQQFNIIGGIQWKF